MRYKHVYRSIVPILCILAVGAAASADQVIKLGYVDTNHVFKNYFKTGAASESLADEYDELQTEVDARKQEIENLRKELQTKSSVLSQQRKDEIENAINEKFVELRSFASQADDKLRNMTNQQTQAIVEEIRKIVQQIGTSEGYTVIFDKAVVLYAAPAFDLTDKVLDELNKSRPAVEPEERSVPSDAD